LPKLADATKLPSIFEQVVRKNPLVGEFFEAMTRHAAPLLTDIGQNVDDEVDVLAPKPGRIPKSKQADAARAARRALPLVRQVIVDACMALAARPKFRTLSRQEIYLAGGVFGWRTVHMFCDEPLQEENPGEVLSRPRLQHLLSYQGLGRYMNGQGEGALYPLRHRYVVAAVDQSRKISEALQERLSERDTEPERAVLLGRDGHVHDCSRNTCKPLKTWPQRANAYNHPALRGLKPKTYRTLKRWGATAKKSKNYQALAVPKWDCTLKALHLAMKGADAAATAKSK
jgi:hypothetical protein